MTDDKLTIFDLRIGNNHPMSGAKVSRADLVAVLEGLGAEKWITKPTGPDGTHELCYAAEPGTYLVWRIE